MVRGKEVLAYLGRTLNGETPVDNHYRKFIAHEINVVNFILAIAVSSGEFISLLAAVPLAGEVIRQDWIEGRKVRKGMGYPENVLFKRFRPKPVRS